jgi:hypothetical protein
MSVNNYQLSLTTVKVSYNATATAHRCRPPRCHTYLVIMLCSSDIIPPYRNGFLGTSSWTSSLYARMTSAHRYFRSSAICHELRVNSMGVDGASLLRNVRHLDVSLRYGNVGVSLRYGNVIFRRTLRYFKIQPRNKYLGFGMESDIKGHDFITNFYNEFSCGKIHLFISSVEEIF